MAKRNPRTTASIPPYVKSPLQLEQWAEYERITAKRASEAKEKEELDTNCALLLDTVAKWRLAEDVRAFVAATMVHADTGAQSSEAALRWRTWALGVADKVDPSKEQAALLAHHQADLPTLP